MRMRIASGVVVLVALGFATLTVARPQGVEPPEAREQADTKAPRPSSRVPRLRAEVELLQLEHEGDVAMLKDMINGLWASEASASMEKIGTPMLEELRKSVGEKADNLGLPFAKELMAKAGFNPEEEAKKQALVDKETAKLLRKMYDQAKVDFLARTTALNEKRLELEDLERRRNASR